MNGLDYAVLVVCILGIAVYGIIRTRGRRNLHDYLRGKKQSWFAIGLSVMATQASAITFLSTPGQGYGGGLSFVQNYFAMPLALVIIAAFFLPLFRKLNVYTAYEYLGNRFDTKTRLLAAGLFLLQRGLAAGITIYAPAIVLSTVFGWSLPLTIIASGVVATTYTVMGGSDAVTHTQKYQIGIIFVGMIAAFVILLQKIPCSFTDSLALAGHFGKLNAVSFNPDLRERYTVWTGMFGGIFLMLAYFGTDQSQVQRYISGDNLRQSRLGLMFNALMKIPMQFGILLLGVMLFVFYQFHPAPIFFNKTVWDAQAQNSAELRQMEQGYATINELRNGMVADWPKLKDRSDTEQSGWFQNFDQLNARDKTIRAEAKAALVRAAPKVSANENDYVFITFILENLPHGLIGLLVTCFFLATLSSKSAELNALASCSVIDFYRLLRPRPRLPSELGTENAGHSAATTDHGRDSRDISDRHYVIVTKGFTLLWGLVAIAFALFVTMVENLIQASNIIGSLFSGVVLGLFLIAFFIKFIRGTAAFYGAIIGQTIVLVHWGLTFWFPGLGIAYLWYNAIGCGAAIVVAVVLQAIIGMPSEGRGLGVAVSAESPAGTPES